MESMSGQGSSLEKMQMKMLRFVQGHQIIEWERARLREKMVRAVNSDVDDRPGEGSQNERVTEIVQW